MSTPFLILLLAAVQIGIVVIFALVVERIGRDE